LDLIMLRKSIILFSLFLVSAVSFGSPEVEREESKLKLNWHSSSAGTWTLKTDAGSLCAKGRIRLGDNNLNFTKIDSTSNLFFETTNLEPSITKSKIEIPALERRSTLLKPTGASVIYQLPPRTYLASGAGKQHTGTLDRLTESKLAEIKELGVDYLWLTGIQEHADLTQTDPDVVKGDAGSYYAVYDNWDVSSIIGDLASFERLIDRAHASGLRVIMDLIPNHTARGHHTDVLCKQHLDFGVHDNTSEFFSPTNNYFYVEDSFIPPTTGNANGADGIFDTNIFTAGIQLETPAKVTGNDVVSSAPENSDWFETVKLNYGWDFSSRRGHFNPVPRTWDQMVDVAKYWVLIGVDGFRVDYAHAVPISFWRYFVESLRAVQPEVFLLAEAYEKDERMKVPGFSYEAMLDAGFDSVYNSDIYWALHSEASNPGNVRAASANRSAAMREGIVRNGYLLTHYMENHDEERVASRHFAPWVIDRHQRANVGLSYSAYAALLPGNMLIHGGQELQEDASVYGGYAGDNGRTSIFDFIYQPYTRTWNNGSRPTWMVDFRNRYKKLLYIKHHSPFNERHSFSNPTFVDLDGANFYKDQSKFIAAYIRYSGEERFLVVLNSDPFNSHSATIHFTSENGRDSLGALAALGITNTDERHQFEEVFNREGWVPQDPAIGGIGIPGWALFKSGDIPSGLFLGNLEAGSCVIFKVTKL
jgi:glycosidase